ncbi:MAG: hypothetical protein RL077_4628 [Verrucomicrobiota bacterium]
MKTTLEVSIPLLRRAKKIAARDGTTLRALVAIPAFTLVTSGHGDAGARLALVMPPSGS